MHVFADFVRLCEGVDERLREVGRVRRSEPDAADAVDGSDAFQELAEGRRRRLLRSRQGEESARRPRCGLRREGLYPRRLLRRYRHD